MAKKQPAKTPVVASTVSKVDTTDTVTTVDPSLTVTGLLSLVNQQQADLYEEISLLTGELTSVLNPAFQCTTQETKFNTGEYAPTIASLLRLSEDIKGKISYLQSLRECLVI